MDDLERARACADRMYANDTASKALGIEIEIPEAGTAFAFACNAYDDVTVAGSGTIEFLRPVFLGDELRAVALEEHRGQRSGLYAVEVVNQDNECVALFRGRSVARGQPLLGD
jgi:acyl-CoA thioesterase